MSTSRRARGNRRPFRRIVAAATAAVLALTGAALVDAATPVPASAAQLPQCPAPGEMPSVGNIPAFTDSNVAVYVGGDFSATGAAAESEGLLVVRGDATFEKASQGVYNVGSAGAGSQITPPGGTTMLAVGGRLTVGSTTKLHVGMNVDGGGNVDVGGTVASTHPIDTNGGAVRAGLGAEAVAPYGDFDRVVRQQSADLAEAHPTPARIERSGKKVSFAADASASLHTFAVEASALTSLGSKVEVDFTGVGPDAPIVVNVTGADATIDLGTVRFDGTQVNGLSSPGLGNASSRILWNFVDARSVTIGQNDHFLGTVLAPFADATLSTSTSGRLYVGGDLRVVGNGIEHHNYPWIGPGAFACVPEDTGTFTVTKRVVGDGESRVPDATPFTVRYSYTDGGAPVTGDLVVAADGRLVSGPPHLPAGTVVTLSEPTLPTIPGVAWGTPSFSPSDEITIGEGGSVAVTLTNTARRQQGGFSVRKAIEGDAADLVPAGTEFTVAYSYELAGSTTSGTLRVGADGTVQAGPQDLPVGSVVTFSETDLPTVPGVVWGAPVFTVDGKPVTSVTVGDGSNPTLNVTNTAHPVVAPVGGFSMKKVVTGAAAGLVPAGTEFSVSYSYEVDGASMSGTLTVGADGALVAGPQNLREGTLVTFAELAPPTVDGVVWGAPVFTVDGKPATSLVIGDGSNPAVTVTNGADPAATPVGGFSVRKSLAGDAADTVPAGTRFMVAYSYELAGATTSGTLTVGADGAVTTGLQNLREGTRVTFGEVNFPSIGGVVWGAPAFSVGGQPVTSIVIGDGTSPVVTVTNTASDEPAGGFSVRKAVTGTAAGLVPVGTRFTVAYSYELAGAPTSGTLTVGADGTVEEGPQNLPVGTVVTFGELAPPTVDGVVWGAPAFSVGGRPVTSVTVGDGGNPTVTVTNTATAVVVPTGGFSMAKALRGAAAAAVPAGTEFAATYEYTIDGVTTGGTLRLSGDGTVVDGPQHLVAGTVVTFGELTPPEVVGVAWGTPVFSVAGTPVTSITIGDGANPTVTLTNTADVAVGTFSVAKVVQGEGAALVPAGTAYTVEYAYGLGAQTVTGTLAGLTVGAPAAFPGNLVEGTVVELREVNLPDVGGVVWGTPVLSHDRVVVGRDRSVEVTLTNTAGRAPAGGFALTKEVVGETADRVPAGTEFTVVYAYDLGGVPTTGTLTVAADGVVVDGPQNLPVGTVVSFEEVDLPSIDGVVWGAPAFSPATVTIADGESPTVTLTNSAGAEPAGGFSIRKVVAGSGASVVPARSPFTVAYSYELDGRAVGGTLRVLADGTLVDGPRDLPVGTVLSFAEVDLPAVAGVVWGPPVFSPASVTIVEGESTAVTLTNTADVVAGQVGGLTVAKAVVGPNAAKVPDGTEFTVAFSATVDGERTEGTLRLRADGTVVEGPANLPAGTVVELEEVDLPTIAGVVWGTPVFTVGGDQVTSVTIGAGGVVAVSLVNTAGTALAVTGSGAVGIAATALLLVGGGALLLVGARRRRA